MNSKKAIPPLPPPPHRWDCHGLPVEYEIDKALGITKRQDVLDMGIDK
jgi:isoleucyl-tRNA synthetase